MLIARFTNPEAGYEDDVKRANALLVVGEEYMVTRVDMGQSYTSIELAGFDRLFNSVQFEFFEDGKPINIYASKKYNPYL